jgi:hypothetical protein
MNTAHFSQDFQRLRPLATRPKMMKVVYFTAQNLADMGELDQAESWFRRGFKRQLKGNPEVRQTSLSI